ncbi:MAG: thiamine-phosphate kinase [Armatimonadota bacterium]|jgi:thiamine-monophosphate kinase
MLLRDIGEFGFIERIAAIASRADDDPRVALGIGDDTALLDLGGPGLLAVTTDAMLEDRHFRLDWLSPREVGWRAAAGALSDLAAMGASPAAVFCSLGLPPDWPVERAEALMDGIARCVEGAGAALAGGDLIASDRVLIDIMALGQVARGRQLTRDGARDGQLLAVTGALGAPAAAVALLSVRGPGALDDHAAVRKRFAHPQPRIAAGRAIAASGLASAAIDISDGLVQDAGHIAGRSHLRAVIEAECVPVSEGCAEVAEAADCSHDGADSPSALRWALCGGEDFELLIALDEADLQALRSLPAVAEVGLTVVGRLEAGEGVVAVDASGREIALPAGGWNHFGRHDENA